MLAKANAVDRKISQDRDRQCQVSVISTEVKCVVCFSVAAWAVPLTCSRDAIGPTNTRLSRLCSTADPAWNYLTSSASARSSCAGLGP
jgi:hypothetical protein